jgi:hypothetical protein
VAEGLGLVAANATKIDSGLGVEGARGLEKAGYQDQQVHREARSAPAPVSSWTTTEESVMRLFAEVSVAKESLERLNLDRGQGMDAKLAELEVVWRSAEGARQARNWPLAAKWYEEVRGQMSAVKQLDQERNAVRAELEQASVARLEAQRCGAVEDAKKEWDDAEWRFRNAETLWNAGRFEEALDGCKAARAGYLTAGKTAACVQSERLRDRAAAELAREEAGKGRAASEHDGAKSSCRHRWSEAEAALQLGQDQLSAGRYVEATQSFTLAVKEYRECRDISLGSFRLRCRIAAILVITLMLLFFLWMWRTYPFPA